MTRYITIDTSPGNGGSDADVITYPVELGADAEHARSAMREFGVAETPIWVGDPDCPDSYCTATKFSATNMTTKHATLDAYHAALDTARNASREARKASRAALDARKAFHAALDAYHAALDAARALEAATWAAAVAASPADAREALDAHRAAHAALEALDA